MYPVSQAFNAHMRADLRRIQARVQIDYTDPSIDQSLSISASEQANVSYPQQTADGVAAATHKWASLDGSWVLDGTWHLAPGPEDLSRYQFGYWSQQLAGPDGAFTEPYPTLTVTHIPRPVHTLRVVGDSARGEWPVDFTINLYAQDGTLLKSETVVGNTAVEWTLALPAPVLDVARQELVITRWSHPGRQCKILEFFTSIQETYYSGDVVEIRLLEEREASQGSLPVGNISANEISIRLANEGGKFDVTNPNSPLAGLLKPNRRIRAWLGIRGDGSGQNVSRTETTQSDFQQGTLSGVVATAAGEVVLRGNGPAWQVVFDSQQDVTDYVSRLIDTGGATWSFDTSQEEPALKVYRSTGFVSFSRYIFPFLIDQAMYPKLRVRAKNVKGNIFIKFRYEDDSEDAGWILSGWAPSTFTATDITIPQLGKRVKGIVFNTGSSTNGAEVYFSMQAVLDPYAASGSRTSPPIDLSPVGIAASNSISWTATTPAGTSVTVETSLDGGQIWQGATNGGPVPGITPGMDLTGKSLLVRQTLTTQDTAVTPVLHDLTVRINHEEWVPLGLFWSTEWQAEDDTVEASVVARDRLELLRKSTYQTSQVLQNTNLHDLAVLVLADAGLDREEYWVDPALQQIRVPYAWFDPVSHREALRIIAEAALAVVYADRDGVVRIEAMGSVPPTPVLTITADDYFPPLQVPSRQDQVANEIVVTTQPLRPEDPQEVYRSTTPITVPAGQTVTVTAKYNQPPVIEAQAALDNPPPGVSIVAATYYAWGAEVTLQNTGAAQADVTLVVTGRPLSVQGGEQVIVRDQTSITENGVLRYEFPANPLVQTLAQAQAIAQALLASAKDPRRDIEVEWRGNPALELGDRVTVVGQDVHVIRQEITWAGALSARLTGRKVTT